MECKYLSDGRKVAIIGKLNNQETIVQEVFVTAGGDEIPSGERFVTKSLHDAPVVSWKEKREKELEQREAEWNKKIERAQHEYNGMYARLEAVKAAVLSAEKFIKLLPEQDLEIFAAFVSGTAQYVVIDGYSVTPPTSLLEAMTRIERDYGREKFDSIKLLSVMGSSDGDITYRINSYRDGSGNWTEVHPFATREEALSHIRTRALAKMEKGHLSIECYEKCIGLGITFPDEARRAYREHLERDAEKGLASQTQAKDQAIAQSQQRLDRVRAI